MKGRHPLKKHYVIVRLKNVSHSSLSSSTRNIAVSYFHYHSCSGHHRWNYWSYFYSHDYYTLLKKKTASTSTATSASASLPKKPQSSGFISEEDEDKIIEWLQENRFIYDMKSKQCKDKLEKTTAWQAQANNSGFEGKLKFLLNCLLFVFILLQR